jgi:nucleotide-binding universal stress UspA family protein
MFTKILYPTDFSPVSEKALKYVKKLREAGTEEVVLLHVIEESDVEAVVEVCAWKNEDVKKCEEEIEKKMMEKVRERLDGVAEELKSSGIRTKILVKIGKPYVEIVNTAKNEGVSLIVIGSHGKSMIREMFLGSVAEGVIHHAHVPVILIKRDWVIT